MTNLEEAENKVREIIQEAKVNIESITSEEDVKIRIINRILSDCLGWPYSDFRAETHHESGFSDYILLDNDKAALLVEAKRIGLLSVNTAERNKVRHLKISGSALKTCLSGIEQAASYSLSNGLPVTALTDGVIWVIFKTFTPGSNYKDKEAIVFPSFDSVISDFSIFYDLLSKKQFGKRLFNALFDGIHNKRLVLNQDVVAPIEESDISLSRKSDIAFDLEKIFSNFFARLTGDDDEDLLIECFVESHESRIADFSLEKMTRNVLGNILPLNKDVDAQLTNLIEENIDSELSSSETGQTVFIIGPTGAGKTTFLERFFRKTLSDPVREKCVLVSANFLDATGRDDTVLDWVTETLISALENELYDDGNPSWDDLQGLFHLEYLRRLKGVDSQLYQRDKQAFKEKFGGFLDDKVENDREGYLKRILKDVVNNRKKLPVILIDNTDEFSIEYKEKIFQYSQALRRHVNHCLVIFPVTDKSAWSFSKTDIFGIYKSKSFFLPTPSPREVFRKRVGFLKQRIHGDNSSKKSKHEYFTAKGVTISIANIDGFAQVIESIFVDHDFTSKTLGELTNYNIRRTLALSQRIITSPVIKIEDLIKSYLSGQIVTTSFSKFIDALMKGDYELYKLGDNHEIFPVFQIDREIRQSPLLKLRILALLESIHKTGKSIEEKHLGIQSIISYFDSIGCSETSVERNLIPLLEAGLIESYDASNHELNAIQKIAISFRGSAHLMLATHNAVFFYQMALTTPITDLAVAGKIRTKHHSNEPITNRITEIKKDFLEYLLEEDQKNISISCEEAQYECQNRLLTELKKLGESSDVRTKENEITSILGDEFKEGVEINSVLATVDFYDTSKGFGFVEMETSDSRIFIHVEKLTEYGLETIKDGDELLCDISRGPKGLFVKKIHDVQIDSTGLKTVECKIVRLFPERGYGFVKSIDNKLTAFFHVSVFPEVIRGTLNEGKLLKAEIGPDKKNGNSYIIKQVLKD